MVWGGEGGLEAKRIWDHTASGEKVVRVNAAREKATRERMIREKTVSGGSDGERADATTNDAGADRERRG